MQLVDPFRQASLGAEYAGELSFERMPRLRELLAGSGQGSVVYRLRFSQPDNRRHTLEGELETVVELQCQRCFRPSRHRVSGHFRFDLVESEVQMALVDEGREALLVEDGRISLPQLLEDEVLLALPVIAMHADKTDCHGSDWQRWMDDEQQRIASENDDAAERENPFAALAGLKDTSDTEAGDG